MGNIFTSFFSRRQEMSPDQALQILLDALNAQAARPNGAAPTEHDDAQPLSVNEWCRHLGLPRQKLDRYIRKELGCNGAEFVRTISAQRQRQ